MKKLRTVKQVVEAFGGNTATAIHCGVGETAVSNWLSRGYIPPGWFFLLQPHFQKKGMVLDQSVFGRETVSYKKNSVHQSI